METWTKVLVYGIFDGFTFSTDELTRINVVLDSGEIVEVPKDFVVSADQMVNKYKIKLKDVIARIENFDLATKAVWINEILYKLGSDYGLHKYCAGYKQGKFDGAMEREKVTVKQFVADWIEVCKEHLPISLHTAMDPNFMKQNNQSSDLMLWIEKSSNQEIFAQAWIFGYTVEKENRYLVKMKGVVPSSVYLKHDAEDNYWYFGTDSEKESIIIKHTKKELKGAGFDWVFDCPGIEIEEV